MPVTHVAMEGARDCAASTTSPSCTHVQRTLGLQVMPRSCATLAPACSTLRWHNGGGMGCHETSSAPCNAVCLLAGVPVG